MFGELSVSLDQPHTADVRALCRLDGSRTAHQRRATETRLRGWGGKDFEPENVVANYPCERSHNICGNPVEFWLWRLFAFELRRWGYRARRWVLPGFQRAFCTEVGHHAASTRRHELAAISFVGIVFVAFDKATSDGQLDITILRHRSTDRIFSERHRCGRPVAAIPNRHSPESFPILSRFMSAKSARRHSGEIDVGVDAAGENHSGQNQIGTHETRALVVSAQAIGELLRQDDQRGAVAMP